MWIFNWSPAGIVHTDYEDVFAGRTATGGVMWTFQWSATCGVHTDHVDVSLVCCWCPHKSCGRVTGLLLVSTQIMLTCHWSAAAGVHTDHVDVSLVCCWCIVSTQIMWTCHWSAAAMVDSLLVCNCCHAHRSLDVSLICLAVGGHTDHVFFCGSIRFHIRVQISPVCMQPLQGVAYSDHVFKWFAAGGIHGNH